MYGGLDRALSHLSQINEWALGETMAYVNEQFYVWEERSKHKWKLDITYLKKVFKEEKGW